MIGLILAIIVFNVIAFKTNKRLTANQIVHSWIFTIAFHLIFDLIIERKYEGYWYFDKKVDWLDLPLHTILLPPVIMMFLNWYPFKSKMIKQVLYIIFWVIGIVIYEAIALLPKPWGYFHYGWWSLGHSAIIDPILLLIVLGYYKWICKLENKLLARKKPK